MLTLGKFAQPFDRSVVGGLPCRMSNVLADSTPAATMEIVRG